MDECVFLQSLFLFIFVFYVCHSYHLQIRNGASLVQLYTSLALDGPGVLLAIKQELAECLIQDGFTSIEQAVGVDAGRKEKRIK